MPEIEKKENENSITQIVRNWSSEILAKMNEKVSKPKTQYWKTLY